MEKVDKDRDFLSILLGVYVIAVGVGVPVFVRDKYFDILVFKYHYYCFCTITMLVLLIGYSLTAGRKRLKAYFKDFSVRKFAAGLSPADYAVLVYILIAVLSTLTSDYVFEAFWGNEGRYTGLFLISWYVLSYFCISRFWRYKNWYVDILLLAGIAVCLFGITDYFQMDILGFKTHLVEEQRPIFTSTLGNINTYTAYVGMITALSVVLYAKSNEIKHMVSYYICMVISFFAIIMGVSDNAYLSLAALFGFLPLYLFGNKSGVQRYLVILATFFSVIQVIDWINVAFSDTVLGIDSAFNMVANSGLLIYVIAGLWVAVLLGYFADYKFKQGDTNFGNKLRLIWLGLLVFAVLAVGYAIYDCNVLGNAERYGALSAYLVFNDEWGTHRGYIWRNTMECYMRLSNWKKLIGFGPETFGILVLRQTRGNRYNELFDSAHNEYLHTLVTVGLVGLTAYLFFIIAQIKQCFCYKKNNPYVIAIAFGIICYSVQAVVNLNLPIVTPVFWLLLGMGAARSIETIS